MARPADEWLFRLALATSAMTLISISAAQVLLTLTLVAWLVLRPTRPRWPGYCLPLAVFMLTTLLSLVMSPDPSVGFGPVRKFVLFSMGILAATFIADERRLRQTIKVFIVVASVAALAAVVQFALQYEVYMSTGNLADDPTILARVTGFMGHWMTFSGEQMLVWCAVVPLLVSKKFGSYWIGAAIVGSALVLSFTLNVWLGAAAGMVVAILYLSIRGFTRILVPIAIVVTVASIPIIHRVSMSFFEGGFTPVTGRLEMLDVGARMIRDNPLFGVGPERVVAEFESYYRGEDLEDLYTGHLHNNFVQIAAERGLLCLAALFWLLIRIGLDMTRGAMSTDSWRKWSAVSGLTVLVAFVSAGLFEYNFGDSEVLMLFLFFVSIPYGLMQDGRP